MTRLYGWGVIGSAVLALAATELLLRAYVVPIEDKWPHRVHMVYSVRNPDAVLGDSHFFRGFVTDREFANLAQGGSSPGALEIVAREYFRHQRPGRVIVEASPQLFTRAIEGQGAQQHDEYFGQNWHGGPVLYVFEPGIARRVDWLADPAKLERQAARARKRRRPGNAIDRALAAEMAAFSDAELVAFTQRVVRKTRPVPNLARAPVFQPYRRMIAFLAEAGARVCMVRTPVTPTYLELIREDPLFAESEQLLRALAGRYGAGYVDFRELPTRFPASLFIDADHLGAKGSLAFASAVKTACFPPVGDARRAP